MNNEENTFDHIYKLFSADLPLCGCGNPETAYELIRNLLEVISRDSSKDVTRLISSDGARHLIFGMMENAGLIDHGTILDYSILTEKGEWYLKAFRTITDWSVLELEKNFSVGFPHDGIECSEECWKMPFD